MCIRDSATSLTVGTASFAAGATATITVTVLVGAGTGSITNVVGITTTTADPVTTNNTSTSTISRIDNADLQVTKTTSISGGTVGATFSYVITFANAGPSAAANVTLTDAVSSNPVSYTHLRTHETVLDLVCRLLLEKKNTTLQMMRWNDIVVFI